MGIYECLEYNKKNDNYNLNLLTKNKEIDIEKYITPIHKFCFYYEENVIINNNDINLIDLICPICYNILNNPICCSLKNNCHYFCKICIDEHLKSKNTCPLCKCFFEYKTNTKINEYLGQFYFKCIFNKEGCKEILNYFEYFNHIKKCSFGNILYECHIEKFHNKNFEKCLYIGNANEIKKHFNKCGYFEYKCKFCKIKILRIDLKNHVEKECKVRIINHPSGCRYIGQVENELAEGFGIYSFPTGERYEGEWKDDSPNGYGIYYYPNVYIYEGDFKDFKRDGYGICNYSNGTKYSGEWKNDYYEGYGVCYYSNGDKYEGEFKNGLNNGYGIGYYNNEINI